ncbi:MAG: hypothetical protein AAGI15_14000 [Pseudomonadota bacterium]
MLQKILLLLGVVAATWWYLRLRTAERSGAAPTRSTGQMSLAQAAAVLGVASDAGEPEIIAAHRRLMKANHPDKGGSDYLAQQVNEARALLLAARRGGRKGK